ncbi:unnamed protein product, partial [Tetraodon nigroviridis]
RRAPGSHLPVRVLRRAANHPDGQLPAGRGARMRSGWLAGAATRRRSPPAAVASRRLGRL